MTTPGRATVTSRLSGRSSHVVFRVESAEAAREFASAMFGARDGNGVAAGSEEAVERASSSSGAPLPSEIRAQFESSTGADLSSVRVHTGAESQQAASAVGAKAYTTGQDIHFGAGQYDPASSSGLHLLAHEVAHTVQQQGGAPHRQNKLAVSTPQDSAEIEADRAADAMVAGAPAQVSPVAAGVAREPAPVELGEIVITAEEATTPSLGGAPLPDLRSPAEKLLSKPSYWDRGGNAGEINEAWSGAPVWHQDIIPGSLMDPDVAEASRLAGDAKAQFGADWAAAQANYNAVVPEMQAYKTAAADAEKKGLLDLQPGGGDLDKQVEGGTLPGSDTTIGGAFNKDDTVGGKKNFDKSKLDREERIEIDKAKKDVANKTDAVKNAEGEAKNKQNGLKNAAGDLNNAKLDLDAVKEEAKKQNLETQVQAMEKSCAIIEAAIGGAFATGTGEGKGGKAVAGAEAVVGMINTLYWDEQIRKVQGEIQVINGGLSAISKIKAMNSIENAKRNVENAIRDVQAAHRNYNTAMRDRATAFQELSLKMESAAKKSGASPKEAAAIGMAVQAVPAIEYVVEVSAKIGTLIAPPSCTQKSALGCGQADGATQAIMMDKVAALSSTKKSMGETEAKWRRRLESVNALVNGAR